MDKHILLERKRIKLLSYALTGKTEPSEAEVLVTTDTEGDSNVNIWNPSTGVKVTSFGDDHSVFGTLAVLTQHNIISSANEVSSLKIWNLKSPSLHTDINCEEKILSLAVSLNMSCLVFGIRSLIHVHNVLTGTCIDVLEYHSSDVSYLRFSEHLLISCDLKGCIVAWQCSSNYTFKPKFKWINDKKITSIAVISLTEHTLVTCSDSMINLYDLNSGEYETCLKIGFNVSASEVFPLEDVICFGTNCGDVIKVDVKSFKDEKFCIQPENVYKGHSSEITVIAVANFLPLMSSGSKDGIVKVWNIENMVQLHELHHKGCITNITFILTSFFVDTCPTFKNYFSCDVELKKDEKKLVPLKSSKQALHIPKHDREALLTSPRKKQRLMPWTLSFVGDVNLNIATTDDLSSSVLNLYSNVRESFESFNKKRDALQVLDAICSKIYPDSNIFPCGSTVVGVATASSDLDVVLIISDMELSKSEKMDILETIKVELLNKGDVSHPQIIAAIFPVLTFRYKSITVDLGINSVASIKNTHLLWHYCQIDDRIQVLITVIKVWAAKLKIDDARMGGLSSFPILLLVLHFMQICEPALAPSLQEMYKDLFDASKGVHDLSLVSDNIVYTSSNTSSIGELLTNFFTYYQAFDFSKVISVCAGGLLDKDVLRNLSATNKAEHWQQILIEDPFSLNNAARAVNSKKMVYKIKSGIQSTAEELKTSNDILLKV